MAARPLTKAQRRVIEQLAEERAKKLLEQMLPDLVDRPGDEGFRRLTQTEKDLSPPAHDRHLRIAYYLYVTNPMAHRGIEMIKDFVIGDGATYAIRNEAARKMLDKHWQDPVNHWDIKQFNKVKELGLYGEQIYPVFVNEITGHVRLGYIDPLNVDHIVPDPGNPEIIQHIVLKPGKEVLVKVRNPATNRLVTVPKQELRVVHLDSNPRSPTYGRLVGECFYFAINRVSNATRGFSDLIHVSDWIDAYDQLLFTHLERLMFLRTFCWDVTLEGADQTAIKAKKAELLKHPPKPGAWLVHNEKEKWQAITPDLKATEHTEEERKVRALILGGLGIPPHWFGEGEDVNRATALAMDTPVFRMLRSRQRYVRFMFEHIFRFVLDQARIKKMLDEDVDTSDLAVSLPEFSARDEAAASQTLVNLVNALTVARSQNWVSDETAARLVALVTSKFGLEVKPDEEMQKAVNVRMDTEAFKAALDRMMTDGGLAGARPERGTSGVSGKVART